MELGINSLNNERKRNFLHFQTIKIHIFLRKKKTSSGFPEIPLKSQLVPGIFFSRKKVLFQRFSAAPGAQIPWKIPEDSAQESPLDTPGAGSSFSHPVPNVILAVFIHIPGILPCSQLRLYLHPALTSAPADGKFGNPKILGLGSSSSSACVCGGLRPPLWALRGRSGAPRGCSCPCRAAMPRRGAGRALNKK